MRREELIESVADNFPNIPKFEISLIINHFLEVIKRSLVEKKNIELRGFGTFSVKLRAPKKARNPKTGDEVMMDERLVPHFKPGTLLRKMVNEGEYFKITKNKKSKRASEKD
ncbi:MAG: integration host factor subunit beta [Spirochaetes bacterium]|nr:integration host factor subunit beta [Spirochaetota bacterium]